MVRRSRLCSVAIVFCVATSLMLSGSAVAAVPSYDFVTPVFGLAAAPNGNLFVADAGQGVVKLSADAGSLVVPLRGVDDVAPLGHGRLFALTGGGPRPRDGSLYKIVAGHRHRVASLSAYEAAKNPDGGEIDSNPYAVAALGSRRALVADAGGNSVLFVNARGGVNWVATLPDELAPTDNAKQLAGCPDAPPDFAFICDLPDEIPAQAVATSVAVGPDGAWYVGELKGFPGPIGMSKIRRIEPGTRHAHCGTDPRCSVAFDGFTSIVDLSFGPDGMLYVTEIDEASFLALEVGAGSKGGTVNACQLGGYCTKVAKDLPMPTASTVGKGGQLYAAIWGLVPGSAQVVEIP
ncbi:MAG: ScyD/ScyE family protein [Actinomycetota bacterium]